MHAPLFERFPGPHNWTDAHFGFGDDVEDAYDIAIAVDPYSIGQSLTVNLTDADDELGALLYAASSDPYALGQPL